MCNPVLAVMAVSTAMSAMSSMQSQKAQNAQLEYQAKVSENNAVAAKYEGQYAKDVAAKEAKQQRLRTAQIIGKQRAAMGASGVVVDEGTFLDVTLDSVHQGKLDELAILHEGDMEAWRAEVNADNYNAQATANRMGKSSPVTAGLMSGMQTGMSYYMAYK